MTIKKLLIKCLNHQSQHLPMETTLDPDHSQFHQKIKFQEVLDLNCLATSLRYLRNVMSDFKDTVDTLNMRRIKNNLIAIMILSLIVNEHIDRKRYLDKHPDC